MADFSISIHTPTDKDAELVAALRWAWGPNRTIDPNASPDAGPPSFIETDKTPAELKDEFQQKCMKLLRDVYVKHKKYLKSIEVIDTSIDITT